MTDLPIEGWVFFQFFGGGQSVPFCGLASYCLRALVNREQVADLLPIIGKVVWVLCDFF